MGQPGKLVVLAIVVLGLSGCAGDLSKVSPSEPGAICKALIGPIRYNSTKPSSRRFAGRDLAPDLKQRNDVGAGLGCPQYRRR